MYIEFDKKVEPGPPNGGLLVEAYRLEDGQFRSLDGFWSSKNNEISIGDVPLGAFGCAALYLKGSVGKHSPYYTTKVLFHTASQATWSGRNAGILKNAPNADRFSVAPYLISSLNKKDLEILDSEEKFFKRVFAKPIWRSQDPRGAMFQNSELARKAGIELSIYEVNPHTTHGDAPLEPRNKIVSSIGGGINVANVMLLMATISSL